MKRILPFLLIFFLLGWKSSPTPSGYMILYCRQFQQIYEDIGTEAISPDSASRAFQRVMLALRNSFVSTDFCSSGDTTSFVFPLKGHDPRYTIGGRGRGYKPEGFDLFDMGVRGSHPAHDLFIKDQNKDNIDDRMCRPVDVLAFSSGIVLASETYWHEESERRGGNYIWIYDPCLNGLFYYAHNNNVLVHPGQWVAAGEKIAEVGRTGFNAFKERSPTHLHFMFLRLNQDGLPVPENPYNWLLSSQMREWDVYDDSIAGHYGNEAP